MIDRKILLCRQLFLFCASRAGQARRGCQRI